MAVTFDAVGPSATGAVSSGSTTLSWTHTVGATGTAVLVGCAMDPTSSDAGFSLSATFGGTSMGAPLGTIHVNNQTGGFITVWGMTGITSGAKTVTITATGGTPSHLDGGSISFKGAGKFGTPVASAPTGTGTQSTYAVTVPATTSGNQVGVFMAAGSSFNTVSSPAVKAFFAGTASTNGGGFSAGGYNASTGSSVATTFTLTAGDWIGAVAVEVQVSAATTYPVAGSSTAISSANGNFIMPPVTYDVNGKATAVSSASGNIFGGKKYVAGLSGTGVNAYFVDQGGSPILMLLEQAWALPFNAGRWNGGNWQSDMDAYMSNRSAQGYNVWAGVAWGNNHVDSTVLSGGRTWDGVYPILVNGTPGKITTGSETIGLNNTFWTRIDYLFNSAQNNGITCFLNLGMQYDFTGAPNIWYNLSQSQANTFGQLIAARYPQSSYPNVFWFFGDDGSGGQDVYFNQMVSGLTTGGDTRPLVSTEQMPETNCHIQFSNSAVYIAGGFGMTKATYNWCYTYCPTYLAIEKSYIETGTTLMSVVYGDGIWYGDEGITATHNYVIRRVTWWALASGARGINVTCGPSTGGDVWQWQTNAVAQLTTDPNGPWITGHIGNVVSYFTGLKNWQKLIPDTGNVLVTAGRGTKSINDPPGFNTPRYGDTDNYVCASRVSDGSLAVIYCGQSMSITIDQTKMASGYTATRVDPYSLATTALTPGSTYTTSGNNSAGNPDWVIVLQGPSAVTYPVAGSSAAVSSASGTLNQTMIISGSAPAVSSTNGAMGLLGVVTGTSVTASSTSGTIGTLFTVAGSSSTVSSANGSVSTVAVLSGSSASVSASAGMVSLVEEIDGSAASTSTGDAWVTRISEYPIIQLFGTNTSKTASTSMTVTAPVYSWAVGDLAVMVLTMNPAAGTVSFSPVTNFSAWSTNVEAVVGSGTTGVRTVMAWCECTTATPSTAIPFTVNFPSATANVARVYGVTNVDPSAPVRGTGFDAKTAPPCLPDNVITAGGNINGGMITVFGYEGPNGSAHENLSSSGWVSADSEAKTTGTTGGQSASNISIAHSMFTANNAAAGLASGFSSTGGLNNDVAGVSIVIASLPPSQVYDVNGTALSSSSASGTVTQTIIISGSATSASSASGAISATGVLAGSSSTVSSASGAVSKFIDAAGSSVSGSSASGDVALLKVYILAGSSASVSGANGAVVTQAVISGSSVSASSASGTISAAGVLVGSSASVSSAAGTIYATLVPYGFASSVSSAGGAVVTNAVISGSASSVSGANGTFGLIGVLTGSASTSPVAAGAVIAIVVLSGSSSTSTGANGAVVMTGVVAGSSATTSSATGSLSRVSPLVGSSAATSSATGAVTIHVGAVTYDVAGTSSPVSVANGTVTLTGIVSGSSATPSGAAGAVIANYVISGSAPSVSVANGTMGLTGVLAGSSVSISSANGTIAQLILVSASGSSISSGTGAVTIQAGAITYPVAGSSTAQSAANGAVFSIAVLAGSSSTVSSAQGTLGLRGVLAGSAAAISGATGSISLVAAVSGNATPVSAGTGSVTLTGVVTGSSAAASHGDAWVFIGAAPLPVAGSSTAISSASGAVILQAVLSGQSTTASTANGTIGQRTIISASGASVSQGSGDLTIVGKPPTIISATSASVSSASGAVVTVMALSGSASTPSSASGSLSAKGVLSGTSYATSAGLGAVSLWMAVSASAISVSQASGYMRVVFRISASAVTASQADGWVDPPFIAGALPDDLSSTIVYARHILVGEVYARHIMRASVSAAGRGDVYTQSPVGQSSVGQSSVGQVGQGLSRLL